MDRLVQVAAHRYYEKFAHPAGEDRGMASRSASLPRPLASLILAFTLLSLPARSLGAQGSPFIQLDDPDLQRLEHLITRGVIADPSPFVRPVTVRAALDALASPVGATATDSAMIRSLVARWDPRSDGDNEWSIEPRLGLQSYGAARRDPLQPDGDGNGAALYGDIAGHLTWGAAVVAGRVSGENRLIDDPDWPGRVHQQGKNFAFRSDYAYLSTRFGKLAATIGTVDRNWGPAGFPGLGVSNAGYPRPGLQLSFRTVPVSAEFLFIPLPSVETGDGMAQRYFAGHRVSIRASSTLEFGLWETLILADDAAQGTDAVATLFNVMTFASQLGRPSNNNPILGVEGRWRPRPSLQLELQFAADDIRAQPTNTEAGERPRPDRWAVALGARGALAAGLSWQLRYERVTSMAYRTSNPLENYAVDGIGLTRTVPDNDLLMVRVGVPIFDRLLLSPTIQFQRQGEGRLDLPVDFSPNTPTFLIGTVRTTTRGAIGVAGGIGPARLSGEVGINLVRNADHVSGRSRTSPEGRLIVTLGNHWTGRLQ